MTNIENIEIGSRIRYARDLRNVTLEDVAKKVGVTKSTIQRYENGKINAIKIPVVESIAIALNVNPSWIVGKSDIMELPTQKVPEIIEYYKLLNINGKREATKRVRELTLIPEYSLDFDKETNMEVASENQLPSYSYFSNVEEAKEYIQKHDVAAFRGLGNLPDSAVIELANVTKANSINKEGYPYDI